MLVSWQEAGYVTTGGVRCVDVVDFGSPDSVLAGCSLGRRARSSWYCIISASGLADRSVLMSSVASLFVCSIVKVSTERKQMERWP